MNSYFAVRRISKQAKETTPCLPQDSEQSENLYAKNL